MFIYSVILTGNGDMVLVCQLHGITTDAHMDCCEERINKMITGVF